MRLVAAIVAFIVGGAVAAAVSLYVAFWGLYGLLRLVCWLSGNQDYMVLMWVMLALAWIVGPAFFVGGGIFAALLTAGSGSTERLVLK